LIRRLEASGLRGRGGGWFPAARKWRAVRAEGAPPVVVANGAEGEPGSIKDRHLMRTRPAAILEGLRLAARAVGAHEAIVYLKGSFAVEQDALADALGGLAGSELSITIRRGADSYVAGEETAVLEVLEGRKAWPRAKPPLPAAVGLEGRPTLVQNVETLARVPAALDDPEAFRREERTLVSFWGDVAAPCVAEVPLGAPLGRLIDERAGGASGELGLVFPAGPSAAPLGPGDLDVRLDPDELRAAGSGLGSAALLLVSSARCPISVAASLADFFERESCGQCPPCSVGAMSLAGIVRALEQGGARPKQLSDLTEAAGFMSSHGYCAHARTGAAAVTGLLRRAGNEVEAHLAAGCCPRPESAYRPFDEGSPARRAIEARITA
jgi:NADH-quinone oxidoreductase subunit F